MKKLLPFLIFSLTFFQLPAQSWQELYDSTEDCWETDWQACCEILEKALVAAREEFGEMDSNYAITLNDLGVCYMNLAKYTKAELLLLSSKAIYEKALGKDHIDYSTVLHYLGRFYEQLGDYILAEKYFLEVKDIYEKAYGKEDTDYINIIHDIGMLYTRMGKFEEAENYYLEVKKNNEKFLDESHPDYASTLNNLGHLNCVMGDYEEAEKYYLKAKLIDEKVYGKEHPDYASVLNNLGLLYIYKGDFVQAQAYYSQAKLIREKIFGKEHPKYATILHNLGFLYEEMKKYEQAEKFYLEAKLIQDKVLGKEHPRHIPTLHRLGYLNQIMGKYKKAEQYFLQVHTICEKIYSKQHPEYGSNLTSLGLLQTIVGDYKQAQTYYEKALSIQKNLLSRATHFSSEQDLAKYIQLFKHDISQIYTLSQLNPNQVLNGLSFDQTLFYQGFLLNTSKQIRNLAISDTTALQQLNLLKSYHLRLANQYAKPIKNQKGVEELKEKINTLEKEMTRTVAGLGEAIRQVNWQEVQAQLQANESAIEFINYTNTLSKNQDSTMYAALVLKPGDEAPQFIPLFEEKELGDFVNAQGDSRAAYANQLYASRGMRGIKPRKSQRKGSKSLLELNWAPLEEHLEGIKTIYYVPSGILHRMNLDAIPISKKETLGDKYELIRLGSTRQLVVNSKDNNQEGEALLFGGIQYEMDSTAITRANAGEAQEVLSSDPQIDFNYYSDRNLRGGSWEYLNWTEKEVADIASILQTADISTNLKTGFTATEEAFLQGGQGNLSPRILHLATHGFFFPDPVDTLSNGQLAMGSSQSTFRMSEHPMIRSGLILAGANHAWQTNESIEGLEDGILTAYEISQMDLSNTELVVLSACETGLGDIEGNEGVYGLQRAFKIAGARYLIMSLWQVPDKETMEFMTTFYRNWLEEEMEIPEAFRATQKAMRKKYEEPYKWAGFVLVE